MKNGEPTLQSAKQEHFEGYGPVHTPIWNAITTMLASAKIMQSTAILLSGNLLKIYYLFNNEMKYFSCKAFLHNCLLYEELRFELLHF